MLISTFVVTGEALFMSKTVGPQIVVEGLGVLVPMSGRVARYTDSLNLFAVICESFFDQVLAYVTFYHGQEVGWLRADLKHYVLFYCWRTGKLFAWLKSACMSNE